MSQNLYDVYNTTFNNIQKDYLYVFSNGSRLENYLVENIKNNTSNEIDDDLLNFETALNTLSIHLRNIKFKIEHYEDEKLNSTPSSHHIPTAATAKPLTETEIQTDKLVNKTLNAMLPLFLIALLANDKDSLLTKPNVFSKSNKEVKRETKKAEREHVKGQLRNEIEKNILLSNELNNSTSPATTLTTTTTSITSSVDDLD